MMCRVVAPYGRVEGQPQNESLKFETAEIHRSSHHTCHTDGCLLYSDLSARQTVRDMVRQSAGLSNQWAPRRSLNRWFVNGFSSSFRNSSVITTPLWSMTVPPMPATPLFALSPSPRGAPVRPMFRGCGVSFPPRTPLGLSPSASRPPLLLR